MGQKGTQVLAYKRDGFFSVFDLGSQWSIQEGHFHPGGLFASVGQMGVGFGISPNSSNSDDTNSLYTSLCMKYVPSAEAVNFEETFVKKKKKKNGGFQLRIKVENPSLRRLISGAIAGTVSNTCVAPLETIRTHLMVGNSGHSVTEVFNDIMKNDGWKGLFRGNLVNVIRVAPSKAIEVLEVMVACTMLIGPFRSDLNYRVARRLVTLNVVILFFLQNRRGVSLLNWMPYGENLLWQSIIPLIVFGPLRSLMGHLKHLGDPFALYGSGCGSSLPSPRKWCSTSFWHDSWLSCGVLATTYSQLFRLTQHPEATVANVWLPSTSAWKILTCDATSLSLKLLNGPPFLAS